MSHLMNNVNNSLEQPILPAQRPVQFSSTFSQSLPRELDSHLRELKASVSTLEKRPIILTEYDRNQDKDLKSEIVKLNKEILGLQSDLYKLNTKYISKGLLSPSKANYPMKTEEFLTPQRTFIMDNETTVRPENHQGTENRILNELNIFLEKINRIDPLLFSRYFNSPENLRRMAAQMDYSTILLNLVQLFNEHLVNDCPKKQEHFEKYESKYQKLTTSQAFDPEIKPIDFKNYFKTSFNENKTQNFGGILKNKPQNIQKITRTPKRQKTVESARKTTEDSMRDSKYSLERESQQFKLYNNRSESERFLHEEQGLDIDEIKRKKKAKQPVIKKRRNMDIRTNLPKKIPS